MNIAFYMSDAPNTAHQGNLITANPSLYIPHAHYFYFQGFGWRTEGVIIGPASNYSNCGFSGGFMGDLDFHGGDYPPRRRSASLKFRQVNSECGSETNSKWSN